MAISLAAYVKKRNGIALGGAGSLRNMLHRSLGAGSFVIFWRYWNPIWGYYLSRNIMKPFCRLYPHWLAVILTFAVSGGIHDVAVSIIRWETTFFLAPWFVLMSLVVLATKKFNLSYARFNWFVRATLNLSFIFISLFLTKILL